MKNFKLTFSDSVSLSLENEAGTKHDGVTMHAARNVNCSSAIAFKMDFLLRQK